MMPAPVAVAVSGAGRSFLSCACPFPLVVESSDPRRAGICHSASLGT